MRKWLYDRPWIWIVVLLSAILIGGFTTLVIAELNKPEIVKVKAKRQGPVSLVLEAVDRA